MRWSRTFAAAYLTLLAAKTVAALIGARRAPAAREPAAAELGTVLVAQPVLSGDPGLRAVLDDNLRELAGARFCWLVDDDDPEGRRVCRDLAARHERVEVVVCPPPPAGVNPKLWKLQRALDSAADDTVLLVLDDDTRLPRPSLGALLDGLHDGTVATGLPTYLPADGLWGRLVEQFVANNAALTYLPLRPITLNGMTWAARAGDLRRLGGFEPVLHSLTDDLAVAGLVLDAGERIVQTASPQWTTTEVPDTGTYVRIMHRWFLFATLLLRRQPPRMVATISLLHGLPPLLLWAVLAGARRDARAALLVLAIRAVTLAAVQRRIHGRVLHRPLVSLAAELAQPLHLAHASVRRTIAWRSRTFRVLDETHFHPVERAAR
jgi:ceramide glucosyltransferase